MRTKIGSETKPKQKEKTIVSFFFNLFLEKCLFYSFFFFKQEDELKWVEEHVPTSVAEKYV